MKVQLLLEGRVVNTQIVSEALHPAPLELRDAKKIALKAAIEDHAIKLSDALRVTFRLFDLRGDPIADDT